MNYRRKSEEQLKMKARVRMDDNAEQAELRMMAVMQGAMIGWAVTMLALLDCWNSCGCQDCTAASLATGQH